VAYPLVVCSGFIEFIGFVGFVGFFRINDSTTQLFNFFTLRSSACICGFIPV
jgi:hypothetical protein